MKFSNLTHNKVVALGIPALLMALLFAAALSVNNAQAQGPQPGGPGDLGPPPAASDRNKVEYDEPYPCDGAKGVASGAPESVDDGHYAAFDAFWDYNKGDLSNNFCPPSVVHSDVEDEETGETYETTTRSEAIIDIRKTVFSIPDNHRAEIVTTTSPGDGQISRGIYTFLPDTSTEVWWLKADDDTTLVMGFSAGLLKAEHWDNPGGKAVQYEFEARERPTCPNPDEEAHFYVFRDSDTTTRDLRWDSSNPDTSALELDAGEYAHYNWVFTCPGTYRVQIQFKGRVKHPTNPNDPHPLGIPRGVTWETSVARLYTFHVGPEDDLGVSVAPAVQNVPASATSTSFIVTATNKGPDDAEDAEVQVYLPEGLEYVADSPPPPDVTYENGVIRWDLGRFGNADTSTRDTASPATLTFRASIDRTNATGTVLVRAEIRNVANGDLDSNSANNVSFAAVRLSSHAVHPPIFKVEREIEEFANSFERVGGPVMAFSPELRTLGYSLHGRGSEKFEVVGHGQIVVANNVELEYEKQWSYWLTLTATDGKNSDSILVIIRVINVEGPKVRIWVEDARLDELDPPANLLHPSASDRSNITLNATVHNLPPGKTPTRCTWDAGLGPYGTDYIAGYCDLWPPSPSPAKPVTYTVKVAWDGGNAVGVYTVNWAP